MTQVNRQVPEPTLPDNPAGAVEVFDIFYTIQGEGPFAGRPAVFVRLAGCTLRCPACDTDYTSKRKLLTVNQVCARVRRLWGDGPWPEEPGSEVGCGLVVLTGGEPLRQDVTPLCAQLCGECWDVQFETNGQLYREGLDRDKDWVSLKCRLSVVCSPKLSFVHDKLKPHVTALKYVLDADHVDPHDGLPTEVLGMKAPPCRPWPGFKGEVYVQPADEQDPAKNKRNRDAAVASCMKYGYRLSYQIHKDLNLP